MTKSSKKTSEAPKREELIGKLKEIQLGLRQNLADLQQKLETLDSEPELLISLEILKRK
jgi:hypothetical protein